MQWPWQPTHRPLGVYVDYPFGRALAKSMPTVAEAEVGIARLLRACGAQCTISGITLPATPTAGAPDGS